MDDTDLNVDDVADMTVAKWLSVLSRFRAGYGRADAMVAGTDPELRRAITFVATALMMHHESGGPIFSSVVALLPPTLTAPDIFDEVYRYLLSLDVDAHAALEGLGRLRIDRLEVLSTETLLGTIACLPPCTGIFVVGAASYRSTANVAFVPGAEGWVPHFCRTCLDSLATAKAMEHYVFLDAGQLTRTQTGRAELDSVLDECGLLVLDRGAATLPIDIAKLVEVDARTADAQVRDLYKLTETSPQDDTALLQRALLLFRTGRALAAFELLKPRWDDLLRDRDVAFKIQMARLAADAQEPAVAQSLLGDVTLEVLEVDQLETVLIAADTAGLEDLATRAAMLLQARFASSQGLALYLLNKARRDGDYESLARVAADHATPLQKSQRSYLLEFCNFARSRRSDYQSAGKQLILSFPSHAAEIYVDLARLAFQRDLPWEALALATCVDVHSAHVRRAAGFGLAALERGLLNRRDTSLLHDPAIAAGLARLAAQVSWQPRVPALRIHIADALSVQTIGQHGVTLLTSLAIQLFEHGAETIAEDVPIVSDDDVAALLNRAMAALSLNSKVFVIGFGELAPEFTKDDAAKIASDMFLAVAHLFRKTLDASNVESIQRMLHLGVLVSVRAGRLWEGILLMRYTAVSFANAGRPQLARNLAEHALLLADRDPRTLRAAWITYADVYNRVGNHHDALVGLALGLSIRDAIISDEERWQEAYVLIRILRDCDEIELALSVISKIPEGTLPRPHRMETLRLTMTMRDAVRPGDTAALKTFMAQVAANLRAALAAKDDVAPALVLLAQLLARASRLGLEIDEDAQQLYETGLAATTAGLRARVQLFSKAAPSIDELRAALNALGETRYADDLGYDGTDAALIARQLLSTASSLEIGDAMLCIETLCDHTLGGGKLGPVADISSAFQSLVGSGISLHACALTEAGQLVRASVMSESDISLVVEERSIFDRHAFLRWSLRFPFAYLLMDDPDSVMTDAVRRSVDGIGMTVKTAGRLLFVLEPALQRIPMNLLRIGNDFLGTLAPCATAPSVQWLLEQRPSSTGRCQAWIPDEVPEEGIPALGTLADRLEGWLAAEGIALERTLEAPPSLRDAELAIVAAHGGLVPGDQFFQVLATDAERRWSMSEFCDRIGHARIVVLFVCSAGRSDPHPHSRSYVGLVRALLSNGTACVVASPWPLDATVPPRWLPRFIASLRSGAPVVQAVFDANQEVSRITSANPVHAFAMHCYGDPSVTVSFGAASRGA